MKQIWDYLKDNGFNSYAIAGIMGNINAESGLRSNNLQDTYSRSLGMTDEEYTTAVDNGTYKNFITDSAGYGLCQWTYHSRKKKLYELAKAKNKSISDINVQLELLVSELKNMTGLYNTLKKATSVKQASDAFMVQFENPYDKSENAKSKRASYGMIYFNKYNNDNSNSQQGGNTPMGVKTYQETDRVQLSKNFNSYEFRCGLGRGCACTTILIDDKLVEYLQKIRDHFGKELQITSAYRCPNYNQSAGGATGSRHTKGQAADFVIKGVAPREVAKYAESIGILGIGLYETNADGHFVHIDTRDYKSFWYGQKQEKRTTFGGTSAPSAPKPSTPKPPVNTNLLMFGMKNDKVKELQEKLNKLNFNCGEPDGIFGADTKKQVELFQAKVGLPVDGIVGPDTEKALNKAMPAQQSGKAKVTASLLNVRIGPSTNYKVIGRLPNGSIVDVVGIQEGWSKLKTGGWVSSEYLQEV